jgi:hypothetical protein
MKKMKTKEIVLNDKKVTIWKMNLGFRTDYQGETTVTSYKVVNGVRVRDVSVDNGKLILMTLVFGIYESTDLNIPAPRDIALGLTNEEKISRIKNIRSWDFDIDKLYDEINALNTDVEEEIIKK